jgi:hypothetical protein
MPQRHAFICRPSVNLREFRMLSLRQKNIGRVNDHPPPIAGQPDTLDLPFFERMTAKAFDWIAADFGYAHYLYAYRGAFSRQRDGSAIS